MIGDEVYNWMGVSPSGVKEDTPIFNSDGLPHNTIINAGAIMVCALLVKYGKNIDDIIEFYNKVTGNEYMVHFWLIKVN